MLQQFTFGRAVSLDLGIRGSFLEKVMSKLKLNNESEVGRQLMSFSV